MAASSITTEVQVCNLALARLGQTKQVSDIETPSTPAETLCALHFPTARRALLRAYLFNFAKKYAQLDVNAGAAPTHSFARAYDLPADFIRLLMLGNVELNTDVEHQLYDVVQQYVYTSIAEDDTGKINAAYVFDETTVANWDTLFVNLMRLQVAHDMAYAFTLKKGLRQEIEDELEDVKLQAQAAAGQEKHRDAFSAVGCGGFAIGADCAT